MDYDDNDYQNQHFQLGGEDNNNFLRPFSLPKFDLDEHLQVHLRFDSLDDSEDILGIRVQEGNNWIQDFSSGTRGIEFSASAAESCSISRQNNIWSEATSTESVEMLLKSVGEDDMLTNKNSTDSISNDVLNNAGNDMTPSLQKDDPCKENVIDADSTTVHNSSSTEVKGATSITASQDNALYHSSGDGNQGANDLKELDKSSLSDVGEISIKHSDSGVHIIQPPVKNPEDIMPKASPFIEGNLQGKVPKGPTMIDPYVKSRVPDVLGSNLAEKDSHMVPSSNLQIDNSLKIADMDGTMSSDPSSQKSSNDFKAPYSEALPSEASDDLTSQEKEDQLLRAGNEICCDLDRHKPLGRCSPPKVPSSSGTQVDSSDVTNACENSVQSKGPGGLLEVTVDEVKLSKKDSDALESQKEEEQSLQASREIARCHLDGHGLVSSCNIGEIPTNLSAQAEPLDSMNDCRDSVHPKGPDGLMEVVVGGMRLSSKDSKMGKCEDDSVEKSKENTPAIFSPVKVEGNDDIGLHDKSFDSIHDYNGEEVKESFLAVKRKDDSRNYCDGSGKKQELSDFGGKATNVTSEDEEACSVGTMKSAEVESHDWMPDVTNQTGDHGVDDHIRSLETVVNECGKEDGVNANSLDSINNVVATPLSANPDTMELCNVTPLDTDRDPLDSPAQKKGTGLSAGSVIEDAAHDGSALKGKTIDSVPQVSDVLSASVDKSFHKKMPSEVKSDVAADRSPSSEVPRVSMELKDIVPTTDVTGSSDATNREISVSQIPGSDLFPSNQNDVKLSGGSKELFLPTHEDKAQVPPCNDVHSSKNESQIGCTRDGLAGHSEACSREMSSISGQETKVDDNTRTPGSSKSAAASKSSKCAIVDPTSIECSSGLNAAGTSGENSQDGVERQEINKPDQICPVSGDLHTANMDISSEQPKCTGASFKKSKVIPEEKSFTFEVGREIPDKEVSGRWTPFPDSPSSKSGSETLVGSGMERCDSGLPKMGPLPQEKEMIVNEMHVHSTAVKGTGKEKGRSIAGASGSKRKSAKEAQVSKKAIEKGRKNAVSSSLEEMQQQCSSLEGCNAKLSPTAVQPSNLPDLNTAASGASLFNQPFTDAQQVQLRAQILVYGYLIQGIPPEEACMASAFGDSDGGRNKWEGIWRAFSEKYRNQKSPMFRTPSRPVSKSSDQASAYGPIQSRVNAPACQTGNKNAALFSSTMSLQSPIWNVPNQDISHANLSRGSLVDPSRILSPMHAYHSPHVRQYAVNGAPWLGQSAVSVSLAPTNNSSVLGVNTHAANLRSGESAQLPHSREFSAPYISTPQFLSTGTFPSIGGAATVSAIPAMQTDAVSLSPNKQVSSEPKSRKKKKNNESDTPKQMPIVSQPLLESLSVSGSSKSIGFPTSVNISNRASEGLVANVCPIVSPTHFQIVGTGTGRPDRVVLAEETCTNIEHARQQAEDAAAFASAAVRHSEGVWSQLAVQRNSGLVSDVEQKLASAAVAASVAASVAKAAAAAAKVAADAALQAKLLTDEALALNKAARAPAGVEVGHASRESGLANVTAGSVSNHTDVTSSSCSIISAAREGARRRVEAASAAAKRAENLDAIVKAAELAAGAVAQAGAIVAMGDPLPFTLNDILDAGPENYWKAQQSKTEKVLKTNVDAGTETTKDNVNCQLQSTASPSQSLVNRNERSQPDNAQPSNNIVGQPVQNCTGPISDAASLMIPDGGDRDRSLVDNSDCIKEGSIVEVSSDENGLGCVWYSARVLCLKDGQAHVCYNTLLADEGSEKLKAWVSLKGEGESAARIRVAHPLTTVKHEGTRKRRREVAATHSWNVGDKVDAWIRDGWWEGVITEKSTEDETKMTVCFSADGGSSVVRSWDLRPSLVWKDGAWIEWLQLKEKKTSPEGYTPKEKRQKLGGPRVKSPTKSEALGLKKPSKSSVASDLTKSDVHAPLALTSKEQIFSVGKATEKENSPEKVKRTALQRQSSRVVFGVPRPGKKRKFMDVSKQLVVGNREKVKEGGNSVKFPKYLMPQSSHGWKTVPKGDQRERRTANFKSRTAKSIKSQNNQSRKVADRDGSSIPRLDASRDEESSHRPFGMELSSSSHADNNLYKNIHLEVSLSNSGQMTDDPVLPEASSGNQSASDVEPEPANNGKQSTSMEKSVQNDKSANLADNSSKTSGANEPRRSNRRIQPTSRLLEGLQSSLMISKIPSSSQDKGSKTVQRGRVLRTRG